MTKKEGLAYAGEARKQFFFEKKNQKTFLCLLRFRRQDRSAGRMNGPLRRGGSNSISSPPSMANISTSVAESLSSAVIAILSAES
jgi:hypothetical protein